MNKLKKLTLKKEVIANIGDNEMTRLKGGVTTLLTNDDEWHCLSEQMDTGCKTFHMNETCVNTQCVSCFCTDPIPTEDCFITIVNCKTYLSLNLCW